MNLYRDLVKAKSIFRAKGPIELSKALARYTLRIFERKDPGEFRPDEADIAFRALNSGMARGVMIDVGAHFGSALSPFAKSNWRIFAFEPDSENRKKLTESFGDYKNVSIDSRALSDHPEENVIFYRSEQSTGISGLSAFHPSHQAKDTVQVTTLDLFLAAEKLEETSIDFLKIDTEGFDLNVLKGVPWGKTSPRLVLCEFEDSKTVPIGYTFHDLAKFLQQKGYKLIISEWYPIQQYGTSHDWRRFVTYPMQLEDEKGWGNILAARDDELFGKLLQICKISS